MKIIEIVKRRIPQIFVAVSVSTVYLVTGLCIGWMAPILPRLMSQDSHIPLTADESSWIVAIQSVGCVAGAILLPILTKTLGRKRIMIITIIIHIVSWLVIIFADTIEGLYVARFLFGISTILTFAIVPIYLTEISEVSIRGILSSLPQFFYNIGAIIEYCIIPYISYTLVGIISIIFPIISFFLLIFVPESPYFLIYTGKEAEAERSLMKLRGQNEVQKIQEELSTIKGAAEESKNVKAAPIKDVFVIRGNRRGFIIVIVLVGLQQFSGELAVMSYTTQIFENSSTSLNADMSVIILGIVQMLASAASSSIVDRIGRRPLLITSTSGLSLSCLSMGIYFYLENNTSYDLSPVFWLPVTSLIVYQSSFCIALGILPYTILGEVIPINVKGVTSFVAFMILSAAGILITKLFQIMTDGIGPDSPFWLFLAFNVAGAIFIYWYLPETMGKTFTEIYQELNEDTFPRRSRKPSEIPR
ncbi:hypothetical protein L9F63_020248 [Diploptera punctata]|uniref:Major facilitator superfamily (MFS) profile domain-containing protein n=1 Tax=Diploptera punctata TaxID=6984 RepID=A0AAD7ZTE6_DIPPU|nr:hypothetical protein L9F63_020248 [Diploptera punctata]